MGVGRRNWLVRGLAAAVVLTLGPPPAPTQAQGGDVVVFAAASLKNALDAINAQWQKETGKKATISYAASSALAKQIEQGAPAQLFICADLDWFGIRLDETRNAAAKGEAPIHAAGSRVQLWIMPTNEELIVARRAYRCLSEAANAAASA